MTTEEKIEEIKKAIEAGVAKRRIDAKGNGANVLRLLRGKRISEKCIEQIYEKLLSYQKKPHELKTRREKYRNSHPNVSPKEKVAALKKAVASGVAKIKLDPWGAGNAIRRLIQGKSVGESKINEMYENFLALEKSSACKPGQKGLSCPKRWAIPKQETRSQRTKTSKISNTKDPFEDEKALKAKVLEQDKKIAALSATILDLEKKIGELREILSINQRKPSKVLGLTVTQKVDIVDGKKYRRWYGIYRENGKRHWIYIGKDRSQAEEKITSWFEKRGLSQYEPRS